MDIIKIIGIGLISLVIIIIVKQYKPEFAVYVSLAASILILMLVFDKLFDVINLLNNIATKTAINTTFITLLIKITGIAILTEFAVSICKDCRRICHSKQNGYRWKNNDCCCISTNNFEFARNGSKSITINFTSKIS